MSEPPRTTQTTVSTSTTAHNSTTEQTQTQPPTVEPTQTTIASSHPTSTTVYNSGTNTATQQINTNHTSPNVTVTVPNDHGDQGKPAEEGGTIGAIVGEYTGLLSEGLGTLFECHIPYVYAELEIDYQTGNRQSPLHTLIIESGGYNTAEKLTDSAQTVDAGWVTRKNPELLVKFVTPSILGADVNNIQVAAAKFDELPARNGWNGLSAIINRKVILLSSTLLNTEHGKLIAKLYMARAMHPELFSELDVDSVCKQIMGANGIYYYGLPS